MTYVEFKNKYNGKRVDYDGSYGSQCWDLAQFYFTEVLGLPASVLSGCGLVSNMLYGEKRKQLDKYFDEVKTTEMVQGDVCIWEYGHIAIFDNWDGKQCYYFSQNPNPSKVMPLTGNGLHAFRLKGSKPISEQQSDTQSEPQSKKRYLNLKPSVSSWKVYKTNKYFIPTKASDVRARLNPQKFNGLSYEILEDYGNYHFKIKTDMFGYVYISGNIEKYDCTITDKPLY